ncbi:TetR/AcrR family transcriptional regulator [Tissierella praeacuta]|uniref:TetR/AcrR family transcriptional regulator n=1 Tax=Tissierella praeacuta TaxID=43131 RepID=UPI0033423681
MSRDFQKTHENLLICAQQHFLELGFERASIREICKDANVTNGAFYNHFGDKEALFGELVEPVVQIVSKMYSESIIKHFEMAKTDELINLWKLSEDTIVKIIEYIYEHFDIFKLLLMCSDGTKYAAFLDDVVRLDVRETLRLMAELKERGVPVNQLEEDEWHMLIHAYYASISEIVMHNYPKASALKYVHTLADFFSSGWQKVLGI